MTRMDPALLFFGGDFYDDELVLQMSYEAQGVYERLLWISHRNVGIPEDPVVIAQMLGLPGRGLTVKRFLEKVWPAIAPCWHPHEGRLVQKRQEQERARRAGVEAEPKAVSEKSERMSRLANLRWGRRIGSDAEPHADTDAARNADAYAQRNAESHSPPKPPSVQTKANHPNARDAHTHADPACEGANAAHAAPEERDPDIQLQDALARTGYRSGLPAWPRRRELTRRAPELRATGLTPDTLEELWRLAQEKSNDDPGALLAHWLDGGTWREVLDEQVMKRKERDLRGRAAVAGDPLEGVYGT